MGPHGDVARVGPHGLSPVLAQQQLHGAFQRGFFFISPCYLLLRYIGSSLCGELSLRSPRLCQIPDSGARLPDAEPRVLFQQH